MADENKPTDKIDIASTELKIGGVNLKGAYILWFAAAVSSAAGVVYGAGKVWSDYEKLRNTVAEIKLPDQEPLVKLIENVNSIEDEMVKVATTVGELQSLGGKLTTDVITITKLMEANDVSKLQGSIATLKTTVDGVQVFTRDVQQLRESMIAVQKDMATLKKDVDSQWNAIDSIGAGALKGK